MSEPVFIKGLDGQERRMSYISQQIAEKTRAARMSAPEVNSFVDESSNVIEHRSRMRLIAAMEKERPFKQNQNHVERVKHESRVDHKHLVKTKNSLFEGSRSRPDAVGRFLRRLREALHANVSLKKDKEARVLSLALARGTDPRDGGMSAASLTTAVKSIGVQLSSSTAEEVVAFVAALPGGRCALVLEEDDEQQQQQQQQQPRMSAKKFEAVVLEESHRIGLTSILRIPDSTRAVADREAASAKHQLAAKKYMGKIDWAPQSSRSDPTRPPLIDAFVAEVAAAIERENTKTRLEASAASATATNLMRLLGAYADKRSGPHFNRHGIGASGLASAMGKLGLDLPMHTAHAIVCYFAGVAEASAGCPFPGQSTWPAQGDVNAVGGGASVMGGTGTNNSAGAVAAGAVVLMPIDRLVAEVTHGKPSVLAANHDNNNNNGSSFSSSSPSPSSSSSVFRAATVLAPRRDVEELKAEVLAKAQELALTSGGSPGTVLRAVLVDCAEQQHGWVDGKRLCNALKVHLGCSGVTLEKAQGAVAFFAELHSARAKALAKARARPGGGSSGGGSGGGGDGGGVLPPAGWAPLEALIEGLGANTKLSNHSRNIGAFNFLATKKQKKKVGGGGGGGIGDFDESDDVRGWTSTSLEASRHLALPPSASSSSSRARVDEETAAAAAVKAKSAPLLASVPSSSPSSSSFSPSSASVPVPAPVQAALGRMVVAAIDMGLRQRRPPLDVLEGLCVRHAMTTSNGGNSSSMATTAMTTKTTSWLSRRRLARVLSDLNAGSSSSSSSFNNRSDTGEDEEGGGDSSGGGSGGGAILGTMHAESLFSWYASLVHDPAAAAASASPSAGTATSSGDKSGKHSSSNGSSSNSVVAVNYKRLMKDAATVLGANQDTQHHQQSFSAKYGKKSSVLQSQAKGGGGSSSGEQLPLSPIAGGGGGGGALAALAASSSSLSSSGRLSSRPRTAPMTSSSRRGGGGGVAGNLTSNAPASSNSSGLTSARAHLTRKIEQRLSSSARQRHETVDGIQQLLPMGLSAHYSSSINTGGGASVASSGRGGGCGGGIPPPTVTATAALAAADPYTSSALVATSKSRPASAIILRNKTIMPEGGQQPNNRSTNNYNGNGNSNSRGGSSSRRDGFSSWGKSGGDGLGSTRTSILAIAATAAATDGNKNDGR